LIAVEDFEKRSRELVEKIEDQATRTRIERQAKASAAELCREVKRVARPSLNTASSTNHSTKEIDRTGKNDGVRVVRGGRVMDFGQASDDDQTELLAPARDIIAGDRVRLRTFGSIGIVDKLKGNEAEVRVGSVRLREKIGNLELLAPVTPKPETKRSTRAPASNNTVINLRMDDADARAELNVIGRTTDEAVDMTDKFLDEAYLDSHHTIRIIHGHGTGALRRAIGEHLRNHPHVARFAQAPNDQGGAGATIVEVKQ